MLSETHSPQGFDTALQHGLFATIVPEMIKYKLNFINNYKEKEKRKNSTRIVIVGIN